MFMIQTLFNRVILAFTTLPTPQEWLMVMGVLVAYGAIAFLLGSRTGFLQPALPETGWQAVGRWLVTLLSPVLLEEMLFRVLLLPHPSEAVAPARWLVWAAISGLFFVVFHPLKTPGLFKAGRSPLNEPIVPVLSALLAIACILVYGLTGSVWSSVLIQSVVMTLWLFSLGGLEKLSQESS